MLGSHVIEQLKLARSGQDFFKQLKFVRPKTSWDSFFLESKDSAHGAQLYSAAMCAAMKLELPQRI